MFIALCYLFPIKYLISLYFPLLLLLLILYECLEMCVALGFNKKIGKDFLNSKFLAFLSLSVNK